MRAFIVVTALVLAFPDHPTAVGRRAENVRPLMADQGPNAASPLVGCS